MDAFAQAVDDMFDEAGLDAILDPDFLARPVKLLPVRTDELVEIGSLSVQSDGKRYHVRPSDMAGFGKGAILEVTGERRRVQSTPSTPGPRGRKLLLNTVAI